MAYTSIQMAQDTEEGSGATAVMYDNGHKIATLRYKLGGNHHHMVFEVEMVGVLLMLHLAKQLRVSTNNCIPVSVSLDNSAVIRASKSQTSKPSQYLLEQFHKAMEELDKDIAERIKLKWVPGHVGVKGNKEADKEAKPVAQGNGSPKEAIPEILRKDLLVSLSALRQILTTSAHRDWATAWASSKRYQQLHKIDKKVPSRAYEKLTNGHRRAQTSALTQLHTNHIPLNFYLFCIKRSDSPDCPHCPGTIKDVSHYLFTCPNYTAPCAKLREKAGRKAHSVCFLTNTIKGSQLLLRFINETGRLTMLMGKLWGGEDKVLWRGEDKEEEEEGCVMEWTCLRLPRTYLDLLCIVIGL
jgi:ribonuclease HI